MHIGSRAPFLVTGAAPKVPAGVIPTLARAASEPDLPDVASDKRPACAQSPESERAIRSALSLLVSQASELRSPAKIAELSQREAIAAADALIARAANALVGRCREDVSRTFAALREGLTGERSQLLAIVEAAMTTGPEDYARAELRSVARCFSEALTPREGWGSAVEGATQGAFADNETWSASAGQLALGFVPVVGQAADFRDLAAALDAVIDNRDGAAIGLVASTIAFFPGLDFLKQGGTTAGRSVLRAAAADLDTVTKSGLKALEERLGTHAAATLEKKTRVINVMRTELISRLDAVVSRMPQNERGLAEKLRNALAHHAKPADIVGALRDVHGIPVVKVEGGVFNHLGEVRNALESAKNVLNKTDNLSEPLRRYLEGALNDCGKLLRGVVE